MARHSTVKVFSMFSGIGGFEVGMTNASVGVLNAEFVGYSEIDKYAINVYERHFKHENFGDATAIDTGRLPDFDILVGGFPCQAFSVAGKRAGFDDARGTLIFEVARILTNKRPGHFILENVKGLLSHDGGQTFPHILEILTDLGYCVEWQVLNSKDFGVPQNRERVYIVGHLGVECRREIFPLVRGTEQARADEPAGITAGVINRKQFKPTKGIALTVTANYFKGPDNHGQRPVVKQIGQMYDNPHNSQAGRIYDKDGISPTLDVAAGGNRQPKITEDARIRRLTPRECERLQGFPDDWTAGESDTQRYKMCGNAVTVNVAQAVSRELFLKCL